MAILIINRKVLNLKNFGITYNPLMVLLDITYKANEMSMNDLNEKETEELWQFLLFIEIIPNKITNRIITNLMSPINSKKIGPLLYFNNVNKLKSLGWTFPL